MFHKPFRVKSNSALRGSEKKQLKANLIKCYGLTAEDIDTILPNKGQITISKIYCHSSESALIYSCNDNPLFFEVEKKIYPTVYCLWQLPKITCVIRTMDVVIKKLAGGADLMLPGVIGSGSDTFNFTSGDTVAVCGSNNNAAIAVGTTIMSSQHIVTSPDRKGKAVVIRHIFGDHLWSMGKKTQPPVIEPPSSVEIVTTPDNEEVVVDHFDGDQLCDGKENDDNKEIVFEDTAGYPAITDDTECSPDNPYDQALLNVVTPSQDENDEDPVEKMDRMLYSCFMTALKTKLKDKDLPVLASTFYRTYVLPCCPPGETLEIKKTSYKKLSKYLKEQQNQDLIQVKELTKGNDNIIKVNRAHPDLRSFTPLDTPISQDDDVDTVESQFGVLTLSKYEAPIITTVFGPSSQLQPFFKAVGSAKRDAVYTVAEVRLLINDYVRERDLQRGAVVQLDPILHDCCCVKNENDVVEMTWEQVYKRFVSKMKAHHQLQFPKLEPIIRKGAIECIQISTQQRASNKKVTLVKNLESFLIDPHQFASQLRKTAQASTSVTELPTSKPNCTLHQVLIQGNQINLVDRILTGEHYGLPRRYLKGLENAPKPKGKKKR